MSVPKQICRFCGEEFERKPGHRGFFDCCPECRNPPKVVDSRQQALRGFARQKLAMAVPAATPEQLPQRPPEQRELVAGLSILMERLTPDEEKEAVAILRETVQSRRKIEWVP